MRKNLSVAFIFGVTLAMTSGVRPAFAHTEGACKEDAKKFCADVKPGGGAIHECMKAHEAELSQACKDNIAQGKEKMKEKREEAKQACAADLKQFCSNVTPGEGREFACLKSYDDKLSAGCKEKFLKHGMGMHKEMHEEMAPPTK